MLRQQISENGVARLYLGGAPTNALSPRFTKAIGEGLAALIADPTVQVILLVSVEDDFLVGPSLRDLQADETIPMIAALASQIERSAKPVIAAIEGNAVGAGLEVAIAAHYRVAGEGAQFGHFGLSIGLLPYAGATQRLPRLMGAGATIGFLRSVRLIHAKEALRLGLVDDCVSKGEAVAQAEAFALSIIDGAPPPTPSRLRKARTEDAATAQAVIRQTRAEAAQGKATLALMRLLDCVEAAQLLPFPAGLDYETEAARDCRAVPATRGGLHIAAAEEQALFGGGPDAALQELRQVAIVGQAEGAAAWCVSCLKARLPVSLLSGTSAARHEIVEQCEAILEREVAQGRLSDTQMRQQLMLLKADAAHEAVATADLVLVLQAEQLGQVAGDLNPGAVLALVLSPNDTAPALPDTTGADVMCLRMAGRAQNRRLVELLVVPGTQARLINGMVRVMRKLGRVAVPTPVDDGGIGSAVWGAGLFAARQLARMGSDPAKIDEALRACGFKLLPFGGDRQPIGAPSRQTDTDDVRLRVMDAMANAGALLVQAGVARRPADVDLAMVYGYGFPPTLGGPMFAADEGGLLQLRKRLMQRRGEDAEFWQPAPLLEELIKNGQKLSDLNAPMRLS